MQYKGWALFIDSDMVFMSDIKKLFDLVHDDYAVMCVKHQHKPLPNEVKMDGRQQLGYYRKNWSSFVLFNCGHKSNAAITPERVNFMKGSDMHAFSWLKDDEIGELPFSYNFISGVSPKRSNRDGMPDVIHYTVGGPWFPECQDVPYAGTWLEEYESFQRDGHGAISEVPTMRYEE
jgi:lipopolysaccharide biosynthesis glycosyltransferase